MKRKPLTKALSIILATLFVLEMLPLTVFAAELETYNHALELQPEITDVAESPISFEITEEREENIKVYQRKDGTFSAFTSAVPIHYEENGEWKDIDNTLVEKQVENKTVLINKENSYQVEFPEQLTSDTEIKLDNGDAEIAFSMRDISASSAVVADTPSASETSELAELVDINSKDSAVTFSNIRPNVDVEYTVGAQTLKESIILAQKPTSSITFEYELNTNDETAILNADSSITVYNDDEVAFVIETPYMFDSADSLSYDVSVSLEALENGNYLITYAPDYNWLCSEDISYPVTIDPTIRLYRKRILNEAMYGTYTPTSGVDSTKEWFIQNYGSNYSELCLNSLDTFFKTNTVITSAKLSAYCVDAGDSTSNANIIAAREITGDWGADTSTVLTKSDNILDYVTIPINTTATRYYWDVTEAAAMWALGQSECKGIALTPYSDDRCNVKVYKGENTYSSQMPWLEIDYKQLDTSREGYAYSTIDMGRAGTVNFNQYTGTFYLERTDLGLSGNLMPISTGMIYDPWCRNSNKQHYFGAYWNNTNFLRVVRNSQFEETVTNEDGTTSTVTRTTLALHEADATVKIYTSTDETNSDGRVKFEDKTGETSYTVYAANDVFSTRDFSSVTVDDGSVIRYYDSQGRIAKFTDSNGNEAPVVYANNSTYTMTYIADGAGRKYQYTGSNVNSSPKLHRLEVLTASGSNIAMGNSNVVLTFGCTATGEDNVALLTSITYPDGEQVKYEYNSDYLMTAVENIDGSRLEISYTNGRVSGYCKYVGDGLLESGTNFYYDSPFQRVIENYKTGLPSRVNSTEVIRYNSKLEEISRYEKPNNIFSASNYNAEGILVSDAYTRASDSAELILNGNMNSLANWTCAPVGAASRVSGEPIGIRPVITAFCYKLQGSHNYKARAYQSVSNLTVGQIYSFGAWAKAFSSVATEKQPVTNNQDGSPDSEPIERLFKVVVEDSNQQIIGSFDFDKNLNDWQFGAASFKATTATATVYLIYDYQPGYVYFDGITLFKTDNATVTEPETDDTEDTDNEDDFPELTPASGYNAEPCSDCSCAQCTTAYYDSSGNWLGYYQCHCNEEDELHSSCGCLGCRQERGKTETKDSYGNILVSSLSDGDYSMSTISTYTSNGNYLATSTDEYGYTVRYNYNADTGLLESTISDSNTADTALEYSYNAMGALTEVSKIVNSVEMSTQYTYSKDLLTSVSHGGTKYSFEYNDYGNTTAVKLNDTTTLISYGYDTYQRNNSVTYANGTVLSYTYNTYDNITAISVDGVKKYSYKYSKEELIKSYDYVNMVVVTYDDGKLSQVGLFTLNDSNSPVEGEIIYSVASSDNSTTENFYGEVYESFGSAETYNPDNDTVVNTETYNIGTGSSVVLSDETDFFGREVATDLQYKTGTTIHSTLSEEITYNSSTSVGTTGFPNIHTVSVTDSSGTEKYNYYMGYTLPSSAGGFATYDYNANAWGKTYVYDVAHQITEEVDAQTGVGYKYTYDANGNITSRTEYSGINSRIPYINPNSTVKETRNYVYDANWTDRLSSYNGQAITYDSLGNPLSYKGATLTWQGRNLMTYTTSSQRVEYTYDADGLRTTKKVYDSQNRLTKTYFYTWADGRLIGYKLDYTFYKPSNGAAITGQSIIRYLYNEDNEVYGYTCNGTTYLFVKDAFGNIVTMYDASTGEADYEFDYSAFGEITVSAVEVNSMSQDGIDETLRDVLAQLEFLWNCYLDSTLIYKDYSYDSDTGMYYLQSRYYDPEVGRFINCDDTEILKDTVGFINGANLYSYCNNDPVLNKDPNGSELVAIISATALIALVVTAFIAVVLASQQLINLVNQLPGSICGNRSNVTNKLKTFVQTFQLVDVGLRLLVNDIRARVRRYKIRLANQKHHIVPRNITLKGILVKKYYIKVGLNINAWYNIIKLIAMFHSALNTNMYYSFVFKLTKKAYDIGKKNSVRKALIILVVVFIRVVLSILNNSAKRIYGKL